MNARAKTVRSRNDAQRGQSLRVQRLVRHLAARYLKYLRKEVRQTDGRRFPCSWPWLGMIANEAEAQLKPIATENGIRWSDVQLLANADRLAGVK